MSPFFYPASTVAAFGIRQAVDKLQRGTACARAVVAVPYYVVLCLLALLMGVTHTLGRWLGLTPLLYAVLLAVLPRRFHLPVLRCYEEELDADFTRATYAWGVLRAGDPRRAEREIKFYEAQTRLKRIRAIIN